VKYIDDMTLLELKIETGRTHQIRVHLSAFWYPIVGDKVYGDKQTNENVLKKFWLSRQALHSYRLEFELYWEPKVFLAELKDDIKKIIWEI
jgi:23S rRNA pseudouridine1911/1915/1917 synthase